MVLHGALGRVEGGPNPYALQVKIPTLVSQAHDDLQMSWEEVKKKFDLLGCEKKELLQIHNTKRRFNNYNYFDEHSEKILARYEKYMK